MADSVPEKQEKETVTTTKDVDGRTVERTRTVRDPAAAKEAKAQKTSHGQDVFSNVIWWIAGVIEVILGLRFIFSLLGANKVSGFGGFIYSISHPFVAPFFNLFAYHPHYGVSRFEIYTLVAMAIVALIALGIVKLANINRS